MRPIDKEAAAAKRRLYQRLRHVDQSHYGLFINDIADALWFALGRPDVERLASRLQTLEAYEATLEADGQRRRGPQR
jgi:hypothetical protein